MIGWVIADVLPDPGVARSLQAHHGRPPVREVHPRAPRGDLEAAGSELETYLTDADVLARFAVSLCAPSTRLRPSRPGRTPALIRQPR